MSQRSHRFCLNTYLGTCNLPLIRIRICKVRPKGNFIKPNLSESLTPRLISAIAPAIRIQADAELEIAILRNGGRLAELFHDFDAIIPHLEVAVIVILPARLHDNLVPHARCDGNPRGLVRLRLLRGSLWAKRAELATRPQLVPIQPDHGAGHPDVACPWEIGDELGNIEGLIRSELPGFREAEPESVETRLAFARVPAVGVDFSVVEARVGWVVGMRHFESSIAFFNDVGHLRDGAATARVNVAGGPARGGSMVAEELGGVDGGRKCREGRKDKVREMHLGFFLGE